MIHKKYRIIILLLICILISNFIFEYKAHAEAIALSSGLILFLKACYAAGITYIGGQAVHKVTKDSQELYKEWQKFINKQPPDKKPPTDWEKSALASLLGLQAWDSFMRLVDSVKDFFHELGSKEGRNVFSEPNTVVDIIDKQETVKKTYTGSTVYGYTAVLSAGGFGMVYRQYGGDKKGYSCIFTGGYVYNKKDNLGGSSAVNLSIEFNTDHVLLRFDNFVDQHTVRLPYDPDLTPIEVPNIIEYYFENNSYQFTHNSNDLKQVYPNLSNLPDGKFVQITDPTGKTTTYYKGSFNDLFNDWINSQNPNNIFGKKPLNLTDTDKGIKIDDNADELPYPNPEPQPEPEVNTALGKIISLLQQIINWNKNIHDKIGKTPEKEPQPEPESLLEKLFKPDTNIKLETDKLKKDRNLSLKFPFSIPWDLARVVKVFSRSPSKPDLKIDIDTEYLKINHTIDLKMITLPIGFFRFAATAFFIFFLASKTRDLIKW